MKTPSLLSNTLQRLLLFLLLAGTFACQNRQKQHKVLVLVSESSAGQEQSQIYLQEVQEIAARQHVLIDISDDLAVVNEENLKQYRAVVFLNIPADMLGESQKVSFERYIENGGGFIGVQSALAEKVNWPWYATLYKTNGEDAGDIVQAALRDRPERELPLMVRKFEYKGGRVSLIDFRPEATALEKNSLQEELAAVLRFVIGDNASEVGNGEGHLQELSRYHYNVLFNELKEPMELSVADDGTVLVIEREGSVYQFDPATNAVKKVGVVPVDATESGHGLQGIAFDPDYKQNKQVYFFYTPSKSKGSAMVVSRFSLASGRLDLSSEKVMLKIPLDVNQSGHLGGSLSFDAEGNLYISTGDNSYALHSSGFSPIDERPGQAYNDAQRSAGNTNDLRGKILRIKPEPNGTYTIPDNNLFSKDGSEGRPEIYVMGCRNPFRIAVDKPSGILYWGEVGPDAGKDSTRGSQGYDEINQVRRACNNGWPYFIGDNYPYAAYNFATGKIGAFFDPKAPVNQSPNNTGSKVLPPAEPAFIYYPYTPSEKFPELGEGARCALGGPVYHYDPKSKSRIKFPEYYDNVLFIGDWSRDWIKAVYMDANYDYVRTEAFMPKDKFKHPIDMEFGPDGALYVLEFGDPWGFLKESGKLVRVEYNMGNRPPVAVASASETIGAAPLTVQFSSKGSFDYDKGDAVQMQWTLNGKPFGDNKPNPEFTFKEPGQYMVVLTVTDEKGMSSQSAIKVKVGNSVPTIKIASASNQSFYWDDEPFDYQVVVEDKEDKQIDPTKLIVSMDFLPQGKDIPGLLIEGQRDESSGFGEVSGLISKSDCMSCHTIDHKAVGPAFVEVAKKYKADHRTIEKLATKIINGGGGVWGDFAMNAHPQLSKKEASIIVKYILSLHAPAPKVHSLPAKGSLELNKHHSSGEDGKYLFSVTYTDKGGPKTEPLTSTSKILLRHPKVDAISFDKYSKVTKVPAGKGSYYLSDIEHGAYIALKNIDLRGIDLIAYNLSAINKAGYVEVRVGSPQGKVISRLEYKPTSHQELWQEYKAALKDPGGKNDLYFVFGNNGNAKNNNPIRLGWIEFKKSYGEKFLVSHKSNHLLSKRVTSSN